jgi:glycosyltransferase involved in cell wall biosynthesis
MKILLVTREFPPHTIGGTGLHSYYLGVNLIELGHDVSVLTSSIKRQTFNEDEFNLNKFKIIKLNHSKIPNGRVAFINCAQRYINETYEKFDVIHAHDFLDFSKIKRNALKVQKIHINPVYSYQFVNYKNFIKNYYFRTIKSAITQYKVQKSFTYADCLIYNSCLTKKITHSIYEYNTPGKTIYNGVDLEWFNFKKNNNQNGLLFMGGSNFLKGADLIPKIAGYFPSMPFKIAGCTKEQFLKRYHVIKLPKNIIFLGHLSRFQVKQEYKKSRALLHPARYESFGNVILEALASGIPVLASRPNYCGASEILNKKTSVIFEPNNIRSIVVAIRRANKIQFNNLECRRLAEKYSWKQVAKKTVFTFQKFSSKNLT